MAAWSLRSEKFELDLLLNVVIAKIRSANRGLIPIYNTTSSSFPNLRLIDWSVLAGRAHFIHYEEVETARLRHLAIGFEQADLWVGSRLLFFRVNLYEALNGRFGWVDQLFLHNLVEACDHFVKGELEVAEGIVRFRVIQLSLVVNVIDFESEHVIFLEIILYGHFSDPLWG